MSNPTSACTPAAIAQRIARLRNFGEAANCAHSFRPGSTSSNIVPSPPGTEFSLPSLAVEPAQVSQAVYGVQQFVLDNSMGFERDACLPGSVAAFVTDVRDEATQPQGGLGIQGYKVDGRPELKGLESVERIPVYVMLPLDTVRWSCKGSPWGLCLLVSALPCSFSIFRFLPCAVSDSPFVQKPATNRTTHFRCEN